jgi:predicted DNA-binding transcriptional regulator YafY
MRADRLLSILLLLQVHRRVTARNLAKRLEVSERTILRDMEALSGSGIPVISGRGPGGGWSLMEGYRTQLTGLNAAEIQSLFLARPTELMYDLGLKRPAEAALLKLEASLPPESRKRAEFARERILIDARGWRDPAESVSCLPVLLDALWLERRVGFVYRGVLCDARGRTGDPLGLVAKGSTWYLVANVAGEKRTYRVARMTEVEMLDEPAERSAGFDLAAFWERSAAAFREKLPRYYATFLASPDVMRWVRYRGWRLEQEAIDGNKIRIRLRFDIEEEAVQFALSFGGRIEAIEPKELRAKVLAGAQAAAQLYEGGLQITV